MTLPLKEHYLESTQSLLGNFIPPVEKTWYNFAFEDAEEVVDITKQKDREIFSLNLVLSPERKIYKRSVYTTLDWLGDVGGLSDAL